MLGEIETAILGPMSYGGNDALQGPVVPVRETGKRRDPCAIRIDDAQGRRIGYLAPSVTAWLGPLIDREMVRVEGCLRKKAGTGRAPSARFGNVILTVFLRPAGRRFFRRALDHAQGDLPQHTVFRAFAEAQRNPDPERIFRAITQLQALEQQQLAPEARLLLALLPGVAREALAARRICTAALLHSLLANLTVGAPRYRPPWTLFPLCWASPQQSPYVLLAEALRQGTAVVEAAGADGDWPHLRVANRLQVPIFIPDGEILPTAESCHTMNPSVLVAAGAVVTVPVRSDAPYQRDCQSWTSSLLDAAAIPNDAAGMLVARGDRVVGMDLFDSPRTFAAIRERPALAGRFAGPCDAGPAFPAPPEMAAAFLKLVAAHARPREAALGLGDEVEITGNGMIGAGLMYAGRLCHLAAFAQED